MYEFYIRLVSYFGTVAAVMHFFHGNHRLRLKFFFKYRPGSSRNAKIYVTIQLLLWLILILCDMVQQIILVSCSFVRITQRQHCNAGHAEYPRKNELIIGMWLYLVETVM